jgi:hypothetical protein
VAKNISQFGGADVALSDTGVTGHPAQPSAELVRDEMAKAAQSHVVTVGTLANILKSVKPVHGDRPIALHRE